MFKQFKERFIKNTLLYKLYRMKKFNSFISNSAFGEEILVNRLLKKFSKGFFVDVGAYNPIIGSLTNQLYRKGWNGLNLDFSKSNIQLFNFLRKRDISLQVGVSDKEGLIDSFVFDPSSGTNTLEKKYADGWSKNFNRKYEINKIKCKKLTNILDDYDVRKNFEFLNIDVETHDFKVLKGLDLNVYKPKLITCEIIVDPKKMWGKTRADYYSSLEDVIRSDISKYLQKYNYKLISHYYLTSFFISEELQ